MLDRFVTPSTHRIQYRSYIKILFNLRTVIPYYFQQGLDGDYWTTTLITAFFDGTSDSYRAINTKVHDYLGINIDYSNNCYVKFTTYNFIEDVLKEAREDMNGTSL